MTNDVPLTEGRPAGTPGPESRIASPGGAARILVVDDDRAFRLSTAELLRADGHEVVPVESGPEALQALRREAFDLLLLDLRMPGPDGLEVVEELRRAGAGVPILMISGFGTVDSAVRALHLGADDFIAKPVEPLMLSRRVAELLERRPCVDRGSLSPFAGMVGRSAAMREVFESIQRVAATDATVLVTGETGTGKELVARAIHACSARREGPFVPVNCAALAEGLLESELFGHVRGSFTGAVSDKPGLFEAASGGTLFLDEVGDVSLALQQRLLRALQEREIRRVGAVRSVAVDVRVVAVTHRDLRQELAEGRFREDLFYRLNVFLIALPPLRARRGDIPLLVETALERLRSRSPGEARLSCSWLAMRMLQAYDWPGNVRELFAMVESAAIRADEGRIEAHHLPQELRAKAGGWGTTSSGTGGYGVDSAGGYERAASAGEDERAAIVAALEAAGHNRTRAAAMLGMGRTTLWRKIRSYGIRAHIERE